MQSHHRDSFVSGLIGLICGGVIGSGYMGFLEPLFAREHAADWFSGTGTWIVGVAAAWLTYQQHSSSRKRDALAQKHLEMEAAAAAARLEEERVDRAKRQLFEELGVWNDYRTNLARLAMTHPMIAKFASRADHLPVNEALMIARSVFASIPSEKLPHRIFLVEDSQMPTIAALEVSIGLLSSICIHFLELMKSGKRPISSYLYGREIEAFRDISEAAMAVASQAALISTQVDKLRPS